MNISDLLSQLPGLFLAGAFIVVWWRDRKFSEAVVRELRDELKRTSEDTAASLEALRLAHARELSVAVEKAYRAGEAASIRLHADEIVTLRKDQQADIEKMLSESRAYLDAQRKTFDNEKVEAVKAARELERLEWENRAKAFTVQVSPFVRVTEDKNILTTSLIIESGFEHQLMVHGVPAFEPHQTVSNREVHRGQSEHIDALIGAAIDAANVIVKAKIAPMGSLVTLGSPIKKLVGKEGAAI